MKRTSAGFLILGILLNGGAGRLWAQTPTPTSTCCQGIVQAAPTASPGPNITGVAVDMAKGLVYTEDITSNQIDVFTTGMAYVRSIGTAGQFNRPINLRVGPDQLLYVNEDSGEDVQVVDPNSGNTLAKITLGGYGRGLAVDANGNIYAAVLSQPLMFYRRLASCGSVLYDGGTPVTLNGDPDPSGGVYGAWITGTTLFTCENTSSPSLNQYSQVSAADFNFVTSRATSGPGQVTFPVDLVQDTAGNYFVKSSGDYSIVGFDTGFNFMFRCTVAGLGIGSSIAVDNGGNAYGGGAANGVVYQLHQGCLAPGTLPPTPTATGNCSPTSTSTPPACCQGIATFVPTASPVPNLTGVAVDMARGLVYAADITSDQIHVFTTGSAYARSFGSPGQFNRPGALRVGPDELLYLSEDSGQDVQVVNPNSGNTLAKITLGGYGRGLAVDRTGNIYAAALSEPLMFYRRISSCGTPLYDGGTPVTLGGDPDPPNEVYDAYCSGTTLFTIENSASYYLNQYSQVSNANFTFVTRRANSGPGQLVFAGDIVQDTAGNYIVKSTGDGMLEGFDPGFNFSFQCPVAGIGSGGSIAVDNGGNAYAGGAANGVVYQLHQACLAPGAIPPTATAVVACTPTLSLTPSPTPTITPSPTPSSGYPGSNPPAPGECFIYPSPARGSQATACYNMAEAGQVEIKVWDWKAGLAGEWTDTKGAGVQTTPFDISGFAPGVYFYEVIFTYASGGTEKCGPHKFAIVR